MPLYGSKLSKKPFAQGKESSPAPKPLVSVGSLFNPNIGASLRPMGRTGKVMVELIASIFVANGLFPRNHPALVEGSGVKLTLMGVIGTGWRNLVFTREKLPQVMIFFAVLLSIGCTTLAILAFIMSFLTGTAHAQVPTGANMFKAANPDSDIALGWMNWLFLGIPMTDYLAPMGQSMPAGTSGVGAAAGANLVQAALGTALAFYSDGILVVAAIILFYHLTSMIVETAHHGVAMGRRANQVWAPIRLVAAVGLLVPIGANGLSSGQYILLQVAAWGSGFASNAWGIFVDQLAADDFGFVPPIAPYARDAVVNTYLAGACAQAYNIYENPNNSPNKPSIAITGTPLAGDPSVPTKFTYTPFDAGAEPLDNDLCGFYLQPPQPPGTGVSGGIATTAFGNVSGAFTAMQTKVAAQGAADVTCFMEPVEVKNAIASGAAATATCPNGAGSQDVPVPTIEQMANDYVGSLQHNLKDLVSNGSAAMATVAATSKLYGWASAGSWFNTVMNIQGSLTDLPRDLVFKTAPPQVSVLVKENHYSQSEPEPQVAKVMGAFQAWLFRGYNNNGIIGMPATVAPSSDLSPQQQQLIIAQMGMTQNSGVDKGHFMDDIFRVVDWIASWNNVWQTSDASCVSATCFTLGVQFTSYNPIAEIAAFGHANINTAYDLFDDYIILQGGASVGNFVGALLQNQNGIPLFGKLLSAFGAAGHMASESAAAIGTIVGAVVVVFFTGGFLCAYFLPLIPFYRFLFGILSYFFSLFEGVICIPLACLAHLTPEGEGFMGDKAKGAYYFVFDIFLRPILMVFGLIAGFLMFDLAASAMNLLYVTAVAGAGGLSYGHLALARLVYSIIYVVILYLCCNNCFKMIDWLPEHAIKWMGGQGMAHAPMGDPMEVGGYMALAGGYVDNQIVSGAGKMMSGSGGAAVLGVLAADPHGKKIIDNAFSRLGQHLPGQSPGIELGHKAVGQLGDLTRDLEQRGGAAKQKFFNAFDETLGRTGSQAAAMEAGLTAVGGGMLERFRGLIHRD